MSFQPSLDNMHALVHAFTNSAQTRREGLKFQGTVYECVRADRFSVYAKHVRYYTMLSFFIYFIIITTIIIIIIVVVTVLSVTSNVSSKLNCCLSFSIYTIFADMYLYQTDFLCCIN